MANLIVDTELAEALNSFEIAIRNLESAAELISVLVRALDEIIDVPNNAASNSRAVSEMVKIATRALDGSVTIIPLEVARTAH